MAFSVTAPGRSTATPAGSAGPITIGASLSRTGDFSADGQAFEKGYKLWAKDVWGQTELPHGDLASTYSGEVFIHFERLRQAVEEIRAQLHWVRDYL